VPVWAYGFAGGVVGVVLLSCGIAGFICYLRPSQRHSPKRESAKPINRHDKRSRKHEAKDESERCSGQLQDGWQELEDDDGNKYYYNELTQTTSWSAPKKQKGGPSPMVPSLDQVTISPHGNGALPAGWEEHRDEDGTPYFVNATERTTTWSRPLVTSRHTAAI